jgi:hypothetical protein
VKEEYERRRLTDLGDDHSTWILGEGSLGFGNWLERVELGSQAND